MKATTFVKPSVVAKGNYTIKNLAAAKKSITHFTKSELHALKNEIRRVLERSK